MTRTLLALLAALILAAVVGALLALAGLRARIPPDP